MNLSRYPPLPIDPSPIPFLVLVIVVVSIVASRLIVLQRVPLIGGAFAGVFAGGFAFGMAGGWKGMQLYTLSVVHPLPLQQIAFALGWSLITSIAGFLVALQLMQVHMKQKQLRTSFISLVMIIAISFLLFIVAILFNMVSYSVLENIFFC